MKKIFLLMSVIVGSVYAEQTQVQRVIAELKRARSYACDKKVDKFTSYIFNAEADYAHAAIAQRAKTAHGRNEFIEFMIVLDAPHAEVVDKAKEQVAAGIICATKLEYVFFLPTDQLGKVRVSNKVGSWFWAFTYVGDSLKLYNPVVPSNDDELLYIAQADPKDERIRDKQELFGKIKSFACSGDAEGFARFFNPRIQNRFSAYEPDLIGPMWREIKQDVKKGKGSRYCKAKFSIATRHTEMVVKFSDSAVWDFWVDQQGYDPQLHRYEVHQINNP